MGPRTPLGRARAALNYARNEAHVYILGRDVSSWDRTKLRALEQLEKQAKRFARLQERARRAE